MYVLSMTCVMCIYLVVCVHVASKLDKPIMNIIAPLLLLEMHSLFGVLLASVQMLMSSHLRASTLKT